ncbi:MAG: glycine zipper family protein [Gammaproteobacteria bacterium]|nr:glycine zipper family protein [Gammaproteobacteria bacterium]MDP2140581.1 glycine zipper family protein [Gammaproteobacteria bacterium]MDP2347350.1 glycine zipper family protein [Gammaproteobacteria bacterium]
MKTLIYVFPLLVLTACAGTDRRPIVDMQGVNVTQYNQDLAECQAYADEVEAGRQVAQGAVAGAVVGAAVGAVVGNSDTVQRAAGAGAVGGGARGAANAAAERRQVISNCLRGRGYRVLN